MSVEVRHFRDLMQGNTLPSPVAVFIFEQYFWLFSKPITDGRTDARPRSTRPRRPTLEVDFAMAAFM